MHVIWVELVQMGLCCSQEVKRASWYTPHMLPLLHCWRLCILMNVYGLEMLSAVYA